MPNKTASSVRVNEDSAQPALNYHLIYNQTSLPRLVNIDKPAKQ